VYQQDKVKRQQEAGKQVAAAPVVAEKPKKEEPKPVKNVNDHELREMRKEYQKQQKTFQKLEEQLNKMKEEKAKLESQLGDPEFYSDKIKFQKLDEDYRQLSAKLEASNKEYDKVFEAMMELEEKIGTN
jgi:ATP-binding cassette, subfamily F, member 3